MSNIDLKRLAEDREYWDSVAPLGATHHWRASDDWYQDCGDFVLAWSYVAEKWAPAALAMHRMARPEIIPRPPQKAQEVEWVDGLPPVGDIVEYAFSDEIGDAGAERWKEGDEIEILAHKPFGAEAVAVAWNITQREASQRLAKWKGKAVFRPLRTKEQREKEEIESIIHDCSYDALDSASAIIAAGFRKGDS